MRTRQLVATTLTCGLALLAAAGAASGHGRGERTRGSLHAYTAAHDGVVVGAKVRGDARTRTRDGATEVRVSARGLAHDATFAARLVNGRCDDLGAPFKVDPSGPATRENEVWLDLRTRHLRGEASDRIRVRPLPSGHLFSIVVYAAANPDPGARVACADLQPD